MAVEAPGRVTPRKDAATLAMVLLRKPSMPTRQQLLDAISDDRAVRVGELDATSVTLEVRGSSVIAALIPAPVPWSQLVGPCATAWWWPEATEVCRSSTAHALVFLKDDALDVFERNLRVTDATALLLRAIPDAVAVYWGAGTLVHSAEEFVRQAEVSSRQMLPLRLWVDFRVEEKSRAPRLYATTGLKAMGLMEIECTSAKAPDDVLGLLFNVAHYLCDNGLVLQEGHTLGLSRTEKHRISHRHSSWDRDDPVLWLDLG